MGEVVGPQLPGIEEGGVSSEALASGHDGTLEDLMLAGNMRLATRLRDFLGRGL